MTGKSSFRRSSMFPKALSQCIEPITRPAFKKQGLAGTKIITEWKHIVGIKLAEHCIPEKLAFPAGKRIDGTLSIAVENGFAIEIQHLQPVIIERIATYFGYKAVTRITISHSYTPELQNNTQMPRKHTIPTECLQLAENVEDEALRNALISIAKSLAGVK